MALKEAIRLRIDDRTGVAPARRAAEKLAGSLGFGERAKGEAAIVVSELGTNLVRHAGAGDIVLRPAGGAAPALDVIAWDRGPGIADIAQARGDGFSTSGGSGTGLGAVGRMSSGFELQTAPGQGTVVRARLGGEAPAGEVDGLVLPMAGEEVSGDAWAQVREGDVVTILLADGLGHGPDAAQAAAAAVRQLTLGHDPVALMERMHGALQSTRGAAAAVARLNLRTGALRFAGIGNIAAAAVGDSTAKSLASMNGTIGHRTIKPRSFDYALPPGALLVMHSDGCRSGWDLGHYPGLRRRGPLVVASVLIRDFERGRDDVSVVVARTRAERP